MAPGIKSEIIIQPLKEGWLEALMSNPFLACLFAQLKVSLLLPLTSSPLALTPQLTQLLDFISQPSAFLWTLLSIHIFLEG